MKTTLLVLTMVLYFPLVSPIASANHGNWDDSVDGIAEIDREMIKVLELRDDQASAYLEVVLLQRQAFWALKESQWQSELLLYEVTIEMLRPILDEAQLTKFISLLGCMVEEKRQDIFE